MLFLTSCNLGWGGEDGPTGSIYDVKFCNNTDSDIMIYTYQGPMVIDKIKLKKGSSKYYNNVTYGPKIVKNAVFTLNPWPDSALVVKDQVINNGNKKYKLFLNQYCDQDASNSYKCYDSIPKWVLSYGRKNGGIVKERKWYSLNKGTHLFILEFVDADFSKALKMYDFEKRGL